MIEKGKRADLYILDVASSKYVLNCCNTFNSLCYAVNNVTTYTRHHRLGHFSFLKLVMMKDQLNLTSNRCKNFNSVLCHIYPLAMQRRLSFVSNNHLSHNAFDFIHCDTWGPYHVPIHVGHRFFLTLVDDCHGSHGSTLWNTNRMSTLLSPSSLT